MARIGCPNPACVHHRAPPAGFARKNGHRITQRGNVARLQCRACGTTWSAPSRHRRTRQHRPELNRRVFELAVSGMTMRRMARILRCSPTTVERKLAYLAQESWRAHQNALAKIRTAHILMDDLETFIHARWRQVSVCVVIRARTGQILALDVARHPSTMKDHKKGDDKPWADDDRPHIVPNLLAGVAPFLRPGATITTDGQPSYPPWIAQSLPGVTHRVVVNPSYVWGPWNR